MKKNAKKIIGTFVLILIFSTSSFAQKEKKDKRPDGPPSIERVFKDLDKNEDGSISLKEAKGPLEKDFKKIDTNEDGFITKEELEKAPKPKRRERSRN